MIDLPDPCLVVLAGAAGSGKSTFAARHFQDTEIVSSDRCRALVADDPGEQSATADAFELVGWLIGKRLARRKLTVVDATSAFRVDRAPLVALARRHHLPVVIVALDPPLAWCEARNADRERQVPQKALHRQWTSIRGALGGLAGEGFDRIWSLGAPEEIEQAEVRRVPLPCDRRQEAGPFDIVGDVHGCSEELDELLTRLGYPPEGPHPEGRRAVFVGDLVDRGPRVPEVLRRVMAMCDAGHAFCVLGNHDRKLQRKLEGRQPIIAHGLAESLEQLTGETQAFRDEVAAFFAARPVHLLLDEGALVVAHAGLIHSLQGRQSNRVTAFALFGDTTGDLDAFGLPTRRDWAASYVGGPAVVYGHTPCTRAQWRGETLCVDTGCVFGGSLSAVRWPERDVVSVKAKATHWAPVKPLG